MIISISFIIPIIFSITSMGESSSFTYGEASQASFNMPLTARRKLDTPHGDKSHRSNASIAMRKRGFHSDETVSENDADKIEPESSHPVSTVDYEWKGSRKKMVMQYFLMIWKELCEKDMIRYSEKTEEKIRKDVLLDK